MSVGRLLTKQVYKKLMVSLGLTLCDTIVSMSALVHSTLMVKISGDSTCPCLLLRSRATIHLEPKIRTAEENFIL